MARSGMRPRRVMQRVARYKKYMTQLGAEELDVVQKYKDQVLEAAASSTALARYVPGEEIQGYSEAQDESSFSSSELYLPRWS